MLSSSPSLELIIDEVVENEFIVFANSSVGEAKGKLTLPTNLNQLDITLAEIERGGHISQNLEELGKKLYDALFSGELSKLFAATKSMAKPTESLDLKLHFNSQTAHLARLPWELLHDGERFLVSSGWINLTRYINLLQNIPTTRISLPFRVLIIISRPLDVPTIDSNLERDAILKGLRGLEENSEVIVDFLYPPTHDHLVEVLSTEVYDAIHFDGHGAFMSGKGYLVFENEYAEKDLIDAETISNTLSRTETKLIVLSACRSATVTRQNMFASVAPALILAGIPAVVAMQFSIPVQAAVKFSRQFYTSISNSNSINAAVMQGRKILFPEKNTWFIPVLYLRSKSDILFKKTKKADTTKPEKVNKRTKIIQSRTTSHFVGRGEEFVRVAKAISLSKSNIIVIWGSGGIGKTTLVYEYANRQEWRFPDGIIWISLIGAKSIDTILDEVSVFFTGKNIDPIPLAAKVDVIRNILNEKKALIVLDNFETIENRDGIQDLISKLPKSTKILITSRNHPKIMGWQTIELYKLSNHELIELFLELGAELGVKVDTVQEFDKVREICELLEGHPLALELIVPMGISTPLSSILDDLRNHPVRGISSALDISFNVMGTDEKTLLSRVSVIDSYFDESAIQVVSKLLNWREAKDELVRRSFIHFDSLRFVIHPVIRQYAYQKLENQKEYHLVAAEHFKNKNEYFYMVDQLYYAEKWQDVIDAMHQLTSPRYMRQLPHLGDLITRLDISLNAAQKTGDPLLVAMIEGDLGNVYNQTGQFEKALPYFQKAYDYGVSVGDLKWQSQGLNFLSTTYVRLGKDSDAINCQRESVQISRRLGDKRSLATSLAYLGDTLLMMDMFNHSKKENESEHEQSLLEASKVYEEAIALQKETEETNLLGTIYTNLGTVYRSLKNYDKAVDYLEKSIVIKVEQSDIYGLVSSSMNLSRIYCDMGNAKQAKKHIDVVYKMHADGYIRTKNIFPMILTLRGEIEFALKESDSAFVDYISACVSSYELGYDVFLKTLESVEKQVDKLVESKEVSQAQFLCEVLIVYWRDKGLVDLAPELVERLEKKIDRHVK